MRFMITPDHFQQIAISFLSYRWKLLFWSIGGFLLFSLLQFQITSNTPWPLVWFAIAILFLSIQSLILSSFIFFFRQLSSNSTTESTWVTIYKIIEWCETVLFTILLPLPLLFLFYAVINI